MAPTTVTPPAVQPKPISTETKPVFPRVTPTNTSNNSSFPPPIPSKPPVTASPTSTSSSRPLPPPVPAKKSSAPPVPSTPKPPVIASSPPVTNNDRVSVANPLYTGIGCAGCKKPIAGSIITVGQNKWHVDCFKCKHCKQDLEHVAFYSMDGQPYCALDYHELFSKRCDYCNTPIEDQSIEALGKFYHVGHFFCRGCSKPFDATSSFMVHDGHPYCEKDYQAKFGHKCMGCGEYIAGEIVGALGGEWHKDCFVCSDCGQSFESVTFYERNNKPFCEIHYKNPLNSNAKLCQQCGVAIDGRYSSAFGKEYHPHHFQCARCSKILSVRVPGMWQEGAPGELICKMCGRK
ncbi:hypothetical protein BDA99DRAFT_442045 [Phascolomyces articulosus]|uniref:LIM zinc-binding domain-containing protein n=1 Tax=Phascolomyces articulosus TaxID=60185 RepID=A0AAD5PD56_9FUNG|nr:hypothetical protein BDA99DRAFT_442045 [Phascolomyces articulosus]